jgi:hypothetical protein
MTLTAGQQAWTDAHLGADSQTAAISGTIVAAYDVGNDQVRFIVQSEAGELATWTATAPVTDEEAAERGAAQSRLDATAQAQAAEAERARAAEQQAAADADFADRFARVVGVDAAEVADAVQAARA